MSKGGPEEVTQSTEPWKGQQKYLIPGFERAEELLWQGGPNYFYGPTYVPWSAYTRDSVGRAEQRAKGGSPVERAMQSWAIDGMQNPGGDNIESYLNNVMGGQYLNSNPWLDKTFAAASRAVTDQWKDTVLPGINASFAGAGGSGSGIQQELALDSADVLGRNLNELATSIYGGNYAQERQNQMMAAGMGTDLLGTQGQISGRAAALAPTASNFDWMNIDRLRQVGAEYEGLDEKKLADAMARWNFNENRPYDILNWYMGTVGGNQYGNSTTTQTPGGSPITGAIGGGLLGYGLGSTAMPALAQMMGNAGFASFLPGALPLTVLGGLLGAFG